MIEKNELMADDFVLVRAAEEKPIAKTDNNAFDVSKTFTTVKAKNKKTGENETFLVTSERDIEIQMEIGVRDDDETQENFEFMENVFTTGEEKIYSRCPDNFLDFLNQYFLKYNRYPNINTNINYYKGTTVEGITTYDLKKSIQGPLTAVYKTSEFPFEQINESMQKALLDSKGGETSIPMTNQHYYIQDGREASYCDCLITKAKMAGTIRGESPISFDGQLVIVIPDQKVDDQTFTLTEGQIGQESVTLSTGHTNIMDVNVLGEATAQFQLNEINYEAGTIDINTEKSRPGEVVHVAYKYLSDDKVHVKDAYPCRYMEQNVEKSYEWGVMPNGSTEMDYSVWKAGTNYFGRLVFVMDKQKEGEQTTRHLDRLYFIKLPENGFEKIGIDLVTFTGATEDTGEYLYALEGFMEENFGRQLTSTSETEENARFKIIIEIITEQPTPKLQMKMETSRFKRTCAYTYDSATDEATLGSTTLSKIREDRIDNITESDMYLDHNLHLPTIYRETEDEIPFTLRPKDYHTI